MGSVVQKFAQIDAKYYEQNYSFQYSQAKHLLSLIDFHRNTSVLDVDCSYSHIIEEISRIIPEGKAIGIDSSQKNDCFSKRKISEWHI